jgi:hypothetical protein
MGLINLKTNLKSLPYGFELPSATLKKYYKDVINNPYIPLPRIGIGYDGFVRGGIVNRTLLAADDVIRITQNLATTQNGRFFALKEAGLQKMNPKLEYGNDVTRTFSVKNTLAQVALGDSGHLYRHGILRTKDDKNSKYFEYINSTQRIPNESSTNRLVKLYKKLIVGNPTEQIIDRYDGGGGSNLGVGETIIRRTEFSQLSNPFTDLTWSRLALENENLTAKNPEGTIREDFRKYVIGLNKTINKPFELKNSLIQRNGIGNYSEQNVQNRKIFYGKQNLEDSTLNKQLIQSATGISKYKNDEKAKETRDLIKFRIEIVDNDNPSHGSYLIFRAIISNISDSYNKSLHEIEYNNRAESFYIQTKTTRKISFNFKVVAESKNEMKSMYQKLNSLAASMYPDYQEFKMRGTLVRITLGDYLNNQYGYITDLTYSIPEETTWEIALTKPDNGTDSDMYELPKMIDVQLGFTPIHNFLPKNSLWQSKFILPIDDTSTNSNNSWLRELKLLQENFKTVAPIIANNVENNVPKTFTEFSFNAVQNSSNYLNFLNGQA